MVHVVVADTQYYDLLGVAPNASESDIKKAYRKKAIQLHPDKNPNDSTAAHRFQELGHAYSVLSDPQKRAAYDNYGPDDGSRGGPGGMSEADMDDLFAQMFGGAGGSGFSFDMGMGGRGQRKPEEVIDYEVTLEELYCGKEVNMTVERTVACAHCKGSGGRNNATPKHCTTCDGKGKVNVMRPMGPVLTRTIVPCDDCHGLGKKYRDKDRCKKCHGERIQKEKKRLTIHIEKGMHDGQRIVLHGEGDQEPGHPPGDVIFQLHLKPHPTFEIRRTDLLSTVNLTITEALLGFSRIVLTHLDGRGIRLSSPPNKPVMSGQVFRVANEGMPAPRRPEERGDLYIVFEVEMPSEEWIRTVDRKALERLLPPRKPELNPRPKVVDDAVMEVADVGDFAGDDEWETDDGESEGPSGAPECNNQ